MPQNPFDAIPSQRTPQRVNPFDALAEPRSIEPTPIKANPFEQVETSPSVFSRTGKVVDEVYSAGKSGVNWLLSQIDDPQDAAFGLATEGIKGMKDGWTGKKEYSFNDVQNKYAPDLYKASPTAPKQDDFAKFGPMSSLLRDQAGVETSQAQMDNLKGVANFVGDVVVDPVNLAGVGLVKKGLGAAANLAKIPQAVDKVSDVAHKAPVLGKGLNKVGEFFDPHYKLRGVADASGDTNALKNFARLAESEARSIKTIAQDEAAQMGKKSSFGPFTTMNDADKLKKIAYHIDEGMTHLLAADEQEIAKKFTGLMDNQWASEVNSGIQSNAKLPDYVPYITKAPTQKDVTVVQDIRATTRFAKEREQAKSLADAVKNYGATDDLVEIASKRLSSGRLAEHGMRTFDDAAQRFGSTTAKPGYRKVNIPNPAGTNPKNTQMFLPEQAADYMERAHAIFTKPDDVVNAYTNAVKVYKSWLVTTPQQATTNLFGNVVNAFMTGNVPKPKYMVDSTRVVIGKELPPNIGKFSGQEIMDAMRKWEIVGGMGQHQDVFTKGKNFNLNPFSADNAAGKTSQFVNQHLVEEPFKVAGFLQAIEDTGDLQKAAIKVKDTFFDYAEISEPVKWLRDKGIAPFITWQIKNVPLQLENLAKRPQKFAQTESIHDSFQNATGGNETFVPHQDQREGLMGSGDGQATRFANPINDLNKLPMGDWEGNDFLLDTVGGSVPWIKGLLELAQNKKIYNKAPIWNKDDPGAIPSDWISMLADKAGAGALVGIGDDEMGRRRQNELAAYILQQNPWSYWGRNIMAPPQELLDKGAMQDPNELTTAQRVGNLTGFRTKQYSPKQQMTEAQRRMQLLLEP